MDRGQSMQCSGEQVSSLTNCHRPKRCSMLHFQHEGSDDDQGASSVGASPRSSAQPRSVSTPRKPAAGRHNTAAGAAAGRHALREALRTQAAKGKHASGSGGAEEGDAEDNGAGSAAAAGQQEAEQQPPQAKLGRLPKNARLIEAMAQHKNAKPKPKGWLLAIVDSIYKDGGLGKCGADGVVQGPGSSLRHSRNSIGVVAYRCYCRFLVREATCRMSVPHTAHSSPQARRCCASWGAPTWSASRACLRSSLHTSTTSEWQAVLQFPGCSGLQDAQEAKGLGDSAPSSYGPSPAFENRTTAACALTCGLRPFPRYGQRALVNENVGSLVNTLTLHKTSDLRLEAFARLLSEEWDVGIFIDFINAQALALQVRAIGAGQPG